MTEKSAIEAELKTKKTGSTLFSEDDAGPTDPEVHSMASQALVEAVAIAEAAGNGESWAKAKSIVENLKPIPWFIWRLSNQVFGRDSNSVTLLDSSVMGLRRLLFAAASSDVFGKDGKVNSVKEALLTLRPDVVAAVSLVHSTTRKMQSQPLDMMWRPLLDEALIRARVGFELGRNATSFGGGRGLLAGFASSIGMPMLISAGTLEQSSQIMEALSQQNSAQQNSTQQNNKNPDEKTYGTSSLQVGAMYLAGCGISNEGAKAFIEFANMKHTNLVPNNLWASCAYIIQNIRNKKEATLSEESLNAFGLDQEGLQNLVKLTKKLSREGHGMGWIE